MQKQVMPISGKYKKGVISLVFSLILLASVALLWHYWPTLVLFSIKWQREIYSQFSELLHQAKGNSHMAGLFLMKLSFWYGLLHAAGPGHGKLIVSTYLATHPSKVKVSLLLTLCSAILQALVAISLVSVLLLILASSMREVSSYAGQFIEFSFFLIMLLGGMLIWRAAKAWCRPPLSLEHEHSHQYAEGFEHKENCSAIQSQPDGCSCGHEHFIKPELINQASSFKEYIVLVFSIGMRPCSGAIMVLLFSSMVGIYWLGVLSALVMALGTALTTSVIALVTLLAKRLVTRTFAVSAHKRQGTKTAGIIVQALGGVVLCLLGALLLSSQSSGLSPIAF